MKAFLLLILVSSAYADIPVISFDGKEEKLLGAVSQVEYQKTLVNLHESVEAQLMRDYALDTGETWKLTQIVIGLGASGEIGIGPWKVGTAAKKRFIYVRKP